VELEEKLAPRGAAVNFVFGAGRGRIFQPGAISRILAQGSSGTREDREFGQLTLVNATGVESGKLPIWRSHKE
jgi:hypothetical protein